MDTKSLDSAWEPRPCNTIQEYLQDAYGRLDQTGCVHAFRGVTRHFDNLMASIDRREIATANPIEIETGLLKEFLLRAWNDLIPAERQRCLLAEARWDTRRNTGAMVVARHHMVPTRCIDWTDCPLRSLFFACEGDSKCDGEVWWFNRKEFDDRVGAQWLPLFHKPAHVVADLERDFIAGNDRRWITALNYMLLADDRLDRQRAWITMAGRLGVCHAEEIHDLGVREKGRLVIPAQLKAEAIGLLGQLSITRESLRLGQDDPADKIAAQIKEEFERNFPLKT